MSDPNTFFLLCNPFSGNGKPIRHLDIIKLEFKKKNVPIIANVSDSLEHFNLLFNQAVEVGFNTIVLIGGDGTLHLAVNQLMNSQNPHKSNIKLALISLGTGNDWIKSYHDKSTINKQVSNIIAGNFIKHDIGRIYQNQETNFFINMAGVGFSPYVIKSFSLFKKLGALGYLLGVFFGILFYKHKEVILEYENGQTNLNCFSISIGIGQYAGGGMRLCPNASSQDGLLDITIIKNINLLDLILNFLALKNGGIIHHKKVSTFQTNKIQLQILNSTDELAIEADGEFIGNGSITIDLIPQAICIIV